MDRIFMPVYDEGRTHWSFVLVDFQVGHLEYHDSSCIGWKLEKLQLHSQYCFDIITLFLDYAKEKNSYLAKHSLTAYKLYRFVFPNCPQRMSRADCGVLTTQLVNCLCKRGNGENTDLGNVTMSHLDKVVADRTDQCVAYKLPCIGICQGEDGIKFDDGDQRKKFESQEATSTRDFTAVTQIPIIPTRHMMVYELVKGEIF